MLRQAIAVVWLDSIQPYCVYPLIEKFRKELKNIKNKELKEEILYYLKWVYEVKGRRIFKLN